MTLEQVIEPQLGPVRAWSYSALKSFEECPQRVYLSKVEKHKEVSSEALDRGNRIHSEAQSWVEDPSRGDLPDSCKRFPSGFAALARSYDEGNASCEGEWAFTINFELTQWRDFRKTWLRIKCDAVVRESDTSYRIIDYKTGRSKGNELNHGTQLMLYAMAAFHMYPDLQHVQGEIWYLDDKDAKTLTKSYSRETALSFKPMFVKRGLAMTTATDFPANPSPWNCRFCSHRQTGVCEDATEL